MRTSILSLAMILGAASAGRAQETCLEQMLFPEVGRWAEYQAPYNIYQMLVPGSAAEVGKVEEIVMKAGEKPAMKMDGMMLNMIRKQMEKQSFLSDACKDVALVGAETVTVAAGKFKTSHFRSAKYTSDTWLADGIPFAMVKSIGRNYEMALTSHGKGAKSSITEVPQSMGGKR